MNLKIKLISFFYKTKNKRIASFGKKTTINKSTILGGNNRLVYGDFRNSVIGYGTYSGSSLKNCKIGNYCSISTNVHIICGTHNYHAFSTSPLILDEKEQPGDLKTRDGFSVVIGNDVWVGTSVLIKGGISIGDGAVIGMGSVVTKDVPPYAIVCGNPARIIKYRFDEQTINKIAETKWWLLTEEQIKKMNIPNGETSTLINMLWKGHHE